MTISRPYLLFLGDVSEPVEAKTARGVAYWRPAWCRGQFRLPECAADLGLPDMTMTEAARAGCRTVLVGVANRGGILPEAWIGALEGALAAGLDVAAGLHTRLSEIPQLREAASHYGRTLHDVRHPPRDLPLANGRRRSGRRLLTVGTDCSVGKMYTALAVEAELVRREVHAHFRATGQTGIFIAGDGVSVDAVVADFIAGAAEWLSPDNEPDHWDVIEGQGSLFHPSYAGVSLGLLHGSQPDALVLCHEVGRHRILGLPSYPLPSITECIRRNEEEARLTNERAEVSGIALNTSHLREREAREVCRALEEQTGRPVVDPVRDGVGPLVDRLLALP